MAKYKQTSCHTWAKCYVCSLVLPRPQAPGPITITLSLHYYIIVEMWVTTMGAAQLPDCPHLCLYVAPNNILAKPCTLYKEGQPLPSLGLLLLYYYSGQFQNMNLELSTQEQHLALRTCTHVLRYPSTHVHCTLYPRVQPHVPGLVTYFLNVVDIQYIVDHFPVLFSYLRWTLTSQYSLPTQSRWFPPQWNLLGVRVCREKLHQGQTNLWLGLTSFHPRCCVKHGPGRQ